MTDKLLVSRREAAAQLSISLRTLDKLVMEKALTTRKVRARVLFERRELERFCRRDHPTRAQSEPETVTQ
jgi:excisionase family DNA binding protein